MILLRHKKVLVVVALFALAGYGALSRYHEVRRQQNYPPVPHRPYKFSERDKAELTATKFIRAVDNRDLAVVSMLVHQDSRSHECRSVVETFCDLYRTGVERNMLLLPREFRFDGSTASMVCSIRNLTNPTDSRDCAIDLVRVNGRWSVSTGSSFFDALSSTIKTLQTDRDT